MVKSKDNTKKSFVRSLEETELILDNIPGLVFYKDANNSFIWVNKYIADAYKMKREDLIGKNLFELYPKEVAQKYFDDDLEVIKSRKPKLNFIEPWDVAEGRRWVNSNKIPLYDDDGKCIGIIGFSTDVTKQVEVEQKLKQAQNQLNSILSNLKDTVFVISEDFKILFKNENAHSVFGEDLVGRNCFEVIKGGEQVCDNCPIQNLSTSDACQIHSEQQIHTPMTNEIKIFDVITTPIENYNSKKAYIEVLRDITSRKRLEEELRKNEGFLKNAQEIAHIGHWKLNASTMEVSGSDELFKIFGLTSEEATLEHFVEVVHPEDREMDLFHIKRGMETGESWDIEHRVITKDGTEKWVHAIGEAIKNDDDKVVMLMGTVQDITERKKLEDEMGKYRIHLEELVEERNIELRESEEWLSTMLTSIGDAVIATDSKGNIRFLNPVAETLTGWKQSEAIKKPVQEIFNIINEKSREAVESPVDRVVREGAIVGLANHTVLISKDGKEIPIDDSGAPIKDKEGKITGVVLIFRDITERNKTEQILKESEEKYRYLIENSLEGVWVIDSNANAILINPSMAKMLGYTIEEMVGKSLFLFMDEKEIKNTKKHLERRKNGISEERDSEMIHKNGKKVYLRVRASPILDIEGNYNGTFAFLSNITQRKLTEQNLIESEEKFRTLVSNIPGAVYRAAADEYWTVEIISDAIKEISGFPASDFIQNKVRSYASIIHPDDVGMVEKIVYSAIDKSEPYIIEYRIINSNGEVVWVYEKGRRILGEDGEILWLDGAIFDITERKAAEQKTLSQTHTMKSINKVFEKALTTETEEELGQICLEIAQELSGAKFGFFGEVNKEGTFDSYAISNPGWEECLMPNSVAVKAIKGMEIRGMQFLPLKDGKSRIFNDPSNHPDSVSIPKGHPKITCLLAVPFKYKGKIIGQISLGNKPGGFNRQDKEAIEILSVAMIEALLKKRVEENIKKSEENLRVSNESLKEAMKELNRSNKELEQFAYVASHDLQEPLRMVASFTQLLQKRYQDKLDDDANDFINYAVEGATRIQNLISDLLIFSRVGTRGKPFKNTDMNSVLETVLNMIRQIMNESRTEVTYDPLPVVLADESQMIQLVQNLISNAIKFRGEETPRIHISGEVKADKWIFSVSDNGIGMESKYFDRIFVIFQRLHKKDKYGGTGIGLSVCKKIIQRHSGKIWVESEPGKGSTFYFSIPKTNKHILKDKCEVMIENGS